MQYLINTRPDFAIEVIVNNFCYFAPCYLVTLNIKINGISNDSRQAQPDNLFIAIKGYRNDGHSFIENAIKKGVKAVISEKAFPNSSVPVIRVKNSRYAQASLVAEFFHHPSSKLKVIGITGTNGKSTSTFMINNVLEAAGLRTGLLGTVILQNYLSFFAHYA